MRRIATLLVVLVACAALRLWLVAHTEVIAKDGIVYVKMAREWSSGPLRVVRGYNYHVGYSVAIAAVHRLLLAAGASSGLADWELSGQVVSVISSLAAMVAVWLLTGMTFGWRAAWVAALLFGLGRKWASLGADVLSDALAVCLQMWAVVLAVMAVKWLQRESKWAVALAAGVGLCAGLGYLVRPEALLVAALAGVLWLACQIRHRKSWRLTLTAVGAMVIVTLACALPYMTAIGALTKKKSLSDLVALPAVESVAMTLPTVLLAGQYNPLRQFTNQLFEALHPLAAFAALFWLVAWAVVRFARVKSAKALCPSPRPEGTFIMLAATVVTAPMLMGLYANVKYLSHRHLMFLAALLSGLAGAGVCLLAALIADGLNKIRKRRITEPLVLAVTVGLMVAGLVFHSLRPLHEGKGYYRQAGQFLGESAKPEAFVLTDSGYILHYSQLPGAVVMPSKTDADGLLERIGQSKATHLVVRDKVIRRAWPKLSAMLVLPPFVELRSFVQVCPKRPDTIRVYRVNREALSPAAAR